MVEGDMLTWGALNMHKLTARYCHIWTVYLPGVQTGFVLSVEIDRMTSNPVNPSAHPV